MSKMGMSVNVSKMVMSVNVSKMVMAVNVSTLSTRENVSKMLMRANVSEIGETEGQEQYWKAYTGVFSYEQCIQFLIHTYKWSCITYV